MLYGARFSAPLRRCSGHVRRCSSKQVGHRTTGQSPVYHAPPSVGRDLVAGCSPQLQHDPISVLVLSCTGSHLVKMQGCSVPERVCLSGV